VAELVETNSTGSALDPQVAVDSNGDAVAVWQQFDGLHVSIWSSRFE
jgi:hypothetical protein